jgi:hypothetical protein
MLTRSGVDGVWRGSFDLVAGTYEYKAAIDGAWNESYGLGGVAGGANIPLSLGAQTSTRFYYDETTHWVTDSVNSVIVTAAGSFQSELGCPGDWDPSCMRSWLEDPDGDGTYTFTTTAIPAGSYDTKAAIDESWTENYGSGGVRDGSNITFTVPANATTTFSYVASSHVLTVTSVAADSTPPVIVAQALPVAPDGANGWYRSSPTVSFSVTDPESAVTSTTGCEATTVATDGATTVTCSATSAGGTATSSTTIWLDATPPVITCGTTPTFGLRATGASVTGAVSDATSGPAGPFANAIAATSTVGTYLASLTATDLAGNPSTTACPYVVGYGLTGLQLRPGSSVRPGSDVTVRFSLVDAGGATISATEARRIAGSCAARLTIDGVSQPRICFGYVGASRTFRWEGSAAGRLGRGVHQLGIAVTAPDGTVVARASLRLSVR